MANKCKCEYCNFNTPDIEYRNAVRGKMIFESSTEAYLRKFITYTEIVTIHGLGNTSTLTINYCPFCGRKV
ncbi:MAG: hypothetical protein IJ593_05845 [Lachnospiraceae bacterium]|nr:hypothetical protein [Lachnospiraceae bacterium]